MGNVTAKEGVEIPRSDAGGMRTFSSSMMLEAPVPAHPPPSDFSMSSTPPDTSPSLIMPQIPQVPLCHADELGMPSNLQVSGSNIDAENVQGAMIATLIQWNHGGNDVSVEGSWDSWSTRSSLQRSGKDFALLKFLPAGVYHYKFLVNGEWRHSPDLPCVFDENGNGINILNVQDNVAENLDGVAEFEVPGSPEESYDSPFAGPEDYSKDPPLLPSQLYLNTQLESLQHHLSTTPHYHTNSMSNSSRPQHVILNHLFVETKKTVSSPPVLALGFTQRFRSKYVTVILHKPVQHKPL